MNTASHILHNNTVHSKHRLQIVDVSVLQVDVCRVFDEQKEKFIKNKAAMDNRCCENYLFTYR